MIDVAFREALDALERERAVLAGERGSTMSDATLDVMLRSVRKAQAQLEAGSTHAAMMTVAGLSYAVRDSYSMTAAPANELASLDQMLRRLDEDEAPLNEQLARHYDEGRIERVLDGELAGIDHTWQRPDRLRAVRELLKWSRRRDRVEVAGAAMVQTARRLAATAPGDLVDLLWSYTLVCKDVLPFELDHAELVALGRQAIGAVVASGDDELALGQAGALSDALDHAAWPDVGPRAVRDLYEDADDLVIRLRAEGADDLADGISAAIEAGSTGTEILMALRVAVGAVVSARRRLSKDTAIDAVRLRRAIRAALRPRLFERVAPQLVRHTEGFEVSIGSRYSVEYADDGGRALVPADLEGPSVLLHAVELAWSSPAGRAMPDEERVLLLDRIRDGLEAMDAVVEIVDPSDSAGTVPAMADCLFCKILAGEIPANVVLETEGTFAFRDINPTAPTHVLVIPRNHIEHAGAVKAEHGPVVAEMLDTARRVAEAEGIAERGYRLVFNVGEDSGNTVPHLHLHVIGGRGMSWPPG